MLLNDSFFEPFRPFADIFRDMEGDGADFWGLSVHGAAPGDGTCPYGFRPDYLQTYFLVFRARLFHSADFAAFWKKQPCYKTFRAAAEGFGAVLTRHFADLGYSWSVYSDTRDLDTVPARNYDHHTHDLHEMVARRRYPVIKRRSFRVPKTLYLSYGDAATLSRPRPSLQAPNAHPGRIRGSGPAPVVAPSPPPPPPLPVHPRFLSRFLVERPSWSFLFPQQNGLEARSTKFPHPHRKRHPSPPHPSARGFPAGSRIRHPHGESPRGPAPSVPPS